MLETQLAVCDYWELNIYWSLLRDTQRIVSVEYLFGRPVIASNFLLGKCHLELYAFCFRRDKNDILDTNIGQLGFSERQ